MAFEYHNKIVNKYKKYELSLDDNNENILVIHHKDQIIMKSKFQIIGSYSTETNVWTWSDMTSLVNRSYTSTISDIRENINDIFKEEEKDIIINDSSIVDKNIIDTILKKIYMICEVEGIIIDFNNTYKIDFYMVNEIIYINL